MGFSLVEAFSKLFTGPKAVSKAIASAFTRERSRSSVGSAARERDAMGNLCSTGIDGTLDDKLDKVPKAAADPMAHVTGKQRAGSLREVYKVGKTLGTGGFSVVKTVTDRGTGQQFACKIMSLPPPGKSVSDNESTRADIFKEIDILIALRHPNIVNMKEYFEENNKVYLIMELLEGGELLDAVIDKGHYSEEDARTCFVQLINAIQYLHSKGIVHRDLKLENLLLSRRKDISAIKLADFGLAKRFGGAAALSTVCGTPQYVAPEIIKGGPATEYGPECDLWSAGVILFILLGGVWDLISNEAKDLIKTLLVVDASKRLTCEQVLSHPWVTAAARDSGRKRDLLATMSKMRDSMRQARLPTGGSSGGLSPVVKEALGREAEDLDVDEVRLADELAASFMNK
eukprot:scaffold2.g6947.t1